MALPMVLCTILLGYPSVVKLCSILAASQSQFGVLQILIQMAWLYVMLLFWLWEWFEIQCKYECGSSGFVLS